MSKDVVQVFLETGDLRPRFSPLPTSQIGAWLRSTSAGVRDALKQESVLALYWHLTGAGHGMSFVAALDSAQQAWRYVELF